MHFWDNSLRFRPNLSGSLFYKEFHALNYICHISIFDNLVWSLLGDRRWSFINLAWSLWGEGKASFMRWEKNFIPIKLTWHDYLIPIFGNCAIFAFASRSIAHLMVRKICSFAPESPPIFLAKGKPTCSSWFLCSQASDPTSSIEYCCTARLLVPPSLSLNQFICWTTFFLKGLSIIWF